MATLFSTCSSTNQTATATALMGEGSRIFRILASKYYCLNLYPLIQSIQLGSGQMAVEGLPGVLPNHSRPLELSGAQRLIWLMEVSCIENTGHPLTGASSNAPSARLTWATPNLRLPYPHTVQRIPRIHDHKPQDSA